jgi:hypothetical protein
VTEVEAKDQRVPEREDVEEQHDAGRASGPDESSELERRRDED